MQSSDCCAGLPTIIVNAPAEFTGNLSGFAGIQWDELFLQTDEGDDFRALSVILHGSNGTSYRSIPVRAGHPRNVWRTTFVAFEASEWTLCTNPDATCLSGTGLFSDVVSDVERLSIHHETSSSLGADSRSDNIQLSAPSVPVPTLSERGLVVLGGLLLTVMLVTMQRRRLR
jgi:hypothetical protein